MNDEILSKPYKDVLLKVSNMTSENKKYFYDNFQAYSLFYDFASTATERDARQLYEKEAVIVDKIELNAANLISARDSIFVIMTECLIEKMKSVSREKSINYENDNELIDAFLNDLQKVSDFRINYLDEIDSKFPLVMEINAFVDKKRLSSKLLKVWSRENKIPFEKMKNLFLEWSSTKRNENAINFNFH